ncbi:Uncharacterised protein [Mycobacteroides abscessus subsp. abscessus]|nr:Uncharacterised protein [Mycobacteroides abscessus subsp. abscessus]
MWMHPCGHRAADHNVGTATQPMQNNSQRRLIDHELGDATLFGHPGQRLSTLGLHDEFGDLTSLSEDLRPSTIVRHRDLGRHTGQLLAPEIHLCLPEFTIGGKRITLPQNVIGVLYRLRIPLWGLALEAGPIGRDEVVDDHRERSVIHHYVMHHQGQHMLLRTQFDDGGPDQGLRFEAENMVPQLGQRVRKALRRRPQNRDRQLTRGMHYLIRRTFVDRDIGPQRLMTGYHIVESRN